MNSRERTIVYRERRARIMEKLDGAIGIIPTAPHQRRNSDVFYPYRPDSDFYYVTHFPEPEAVAVLTPGGTFGDFILFCRERDPQMEIWDGKRTGIEGAIELYQADAAYPISKLDEMLPGLIEGRERIFGPLGRYPEFDAQLMQWLNLARRKSRTGIRAPEQLVDIGSIIHEMRLVKEPEEIRTIIHVAQISANAHQHAMQVCRPEMTEFQIQAEVEWCFSRNDCAPAYPSIVASGANACILHYIENSTPLQDGDLLLIDAGAEYDGYASDITRTFPINGQYNACQRAVYEVVLEAQKRAIDAAKPGNRYSDVDNAARLTLIEGLIALGILAGSIDEALENETYQRYYMHRVGHWLGLDVHDVGHYRDDAGAWRQLEPNMYLTVEPGLYLSPSADLHPKWHGIGIRIEDDVLITEDSNRVTTSGVPKEMDEIEQLMAD